MILKRTEKVQFAGDADILRKEVRLYVIIVKKLYVLCYKDEKNQNLNPKLFTPTERKEMNEYYEKKQKDSMQLAVYLGWLMLIAVGVGQCYCTYRWLTHKCPESKPVLMNVSAFCPCEKCCDVFADGVTASGAAAEGYFVAAPPDYAFGTLMAVPGYADGRPVPVLDRGGAIKGNKLDVFFPTHQEALNWGRQYLAVRVE